MEKVDDKNRWWVRLFKVLYVFLLAFTVFVIAVFINSEYYFDSFISHEFLLRFGGYTLVAYVVIELVRRVILYISTGKKFSEIHLSKVYKFLFSFFVLALMIGLILIPVDKYKEKDKQETWKREQKDKYELAVSRLPGLQEQLRQCSLPVIEDKLADAVRSCNLLKGKVKHEYNFCVSLSSINSPASCLYDNDYQKIDCSEQTQKNIVLAGLSKYDLSNECSLILDKVTEVNNTISTYEMVNK